MRVNEMRMTMITDMIPCVMAYFDFCFLFLVALLASLARDTSLPLCCWLEK